MNKIIIVSSLIIGGLISFTSCKKEEGVGGSASIKGKVYNKLYDPNGKFLEKEEAREENVYIIYGDNEIYDDRMDTHSDGSYEFKYLRTGDYTIFAYSDCKTCDSQVKAVEVSVNISDKKETVTAPDIEVIKNIDIDDGTSTIRGKVFVKEYNASNQFLWDFYGPNERVYIVYDNDNTYFDNMRTSSDGSYEFRELIEGSYTIYAYSDCAQPLQCANGVKPIEVQVTIDEKNEEFQVNDIVIDKRP